MVSYNFRVLKNRFFDIGNKNISSSKWYANKILRFDGVQIH